MHEVAKEQDAQTKRAPWSHLPTLGVGAGFGMLEGVKVLDMTTSIAGPYATMLLSDFGAEVIKVERPGGDDARHWGPPFLDGEALWFTAVNRNKKSVILDLKADDGRAQFDALVADTDVLVVNQLARVQHKLKLDYNTLRRINPSLVHVSITGFGLEGDRADQTCYDLIAEGYSGIMDLTGTADRSPQKIGAPAADMLAGQDAAMATMAALFRRQTTGEGAAIDVSLVESMTRFLSCRISSYLGSGDVPTRTGGTDSVIAVYQSFDTADRPINLGLGTDAIWKRFWDAVGDPAFGARSEFSTNAKRRASRSEIVTRIQHVLLTHTRQDWLHRLAAAGVPVGPINSVADIADDQVLQDRSLFYALKDGGRIVPQIGLGIRIDGAHATPRSVPPRLGEHTDEVLGKLNLNTRNMTISKERKKK